MEYADYTFYTSSFLGSAISEADFPRLALRASQFLDYYTMGKAKNFPELENLKMACCAVAEKCQVVEKAEKSASESMNEGGNLKSESVGSYSVSYQTAGEKISAAESARNGIAAVARMYLGGTGLLYRGGCCGCTHHTP